MIPLGITKIKYAFVFVIQLLGITLCLELVFSDSGCTVTTSPYWGIWTESGRSEITTESSPNAVL